MSHQRKEVIEMCDENKVSELELEISRIRAGYILQAKEIKKLKSERDDALARVARLERGQVLPRYLRG